jgi:hypothetical protein
VLRLSRLVLAVLVAATVGPVVGLTACGSDDGAPGGDGGGVTVGQAGQGGGDASGKAGGGGGGDAGSGNKEGSGGGSGSGPGGGAGKAGPEQAAASKRTGTLYRDLGSGDAKGICASLSENARDMIGKAAGEGTTCEQYFADTLAQTPKAVRSKAGKATITGVQVDGDKATGTVSFGGKATGSVALVKQDGEWRLESFSLPPAPAAAPTSDDGG